MLGTGRIEPAAAGHQELDGRLPACSSPSKGECNYGQHEIGVPLRRRADPPPTSHSIYKTRAKARSRPAGTPSRSWPSRTSAKATPATSTTVPDRRRHAGRRLLDGQQWAVADRDGHDWRSARRLRARADAAAGADDQPYKRFALGSFAPTAVAWGPDNRTCSLRLVGHGPSLRVECQCAWRRRQPLPGPGRHLPTPPPCPGSTRVDVSPVTGNAYTTDGCQGCPRR